MEIELDSAVFDVLLADLEPKPCPEEDCRGGWVSYPEWEGDVQPCTRCTGGIVPGVAVIPLEEEPTTCDCWVLDGATEHSADCGVRVDRLTIREADRNCGEVHAQFDVYHPEGHPGREVSVRVVGWADGQMTVEREA